MLLTPIYIFFTKIDLDRIIPGVFIYLLVSGYESRRAPYIRSNFRFESRGKVSTSFPSLLLGGITKVSGINGIEFLEVASSLSFFPHPLPAYASQKRRSARRWFAGRSSPAALVRETEES